MNDDAVNASSLPSAQVVPAIVGLISEVYGDVAKPGALVVGRALETVLETATSFLFPFDLWKDKKRHILARHLKRLSEKLAESTQRGEEVVPAAPEIGNPIIEKLTYLTDDDLSELFLNLLRRACIKSEGRYAHPRFVEIISNLSPDEARILAATYEEGSFRCISLRWESPVQSIDGNRERRYYDTERLSCALEDRTLILFPENVPKYLISMQSLGLIEIREDASLDTSIDTDEYEVLKARYAGAIDDGLLSADGFKSRIVFGRIDYTEFGKYFIEACVKSEDAEPLKEPKAKKSAGRKTTKKVKEARVFGENGPTKPSSYRQPPDVLRDSVGRLTECLNQIGAPLGIKATSDYMHMARILRDIQALSKQDYNGIRDFNEVAYNFTHGEGADEGQIVFAARFVDIFVKRTIRG